MGSRKKEKKEEGAKRGGRDQRSGINKLRGYTRNEKWNMKESVHTALGMNAKTATSCTESLFTCLNGCIIIIVHLCMYVHVEPSRNGLQRQKHQLHQSLHQHKICQFVYKKRESKMVTHDIIQSQ